MCQMQPWPNTLEVYILKEYVEWQQIYIFVHKQ